MKFGLSVAIDKHGCYCISAIPDARKLGKGGMNGKGKRIYSLLTGVVVNSACKRMFFFEMRMSQIFLFTGVIQLIIRLHSDESKFVAVVRRTPLLIRARYLVQEIGRCDFNNLAMIERATTDKNGQNHRKSDRKTVFSQVFAPLQFKSSYPLESLVLSLVLSPLHFSFWDSQHIYYESSTGSHNEAEPSLCRRPSSPRRSTSYDSNSLLIR
eukprot:scaffold19232_cov50-Attheya_sp.AAC.4